MAEKTIEKKTRKKKKRRAPRVISQSPEILSQAAAPSEPPSAELKPKPTKDTRRWLFLGWGYCC